MFDQSATRLFVELLGCAILLLSVGFSCPWSISRPVGRVASWLGARRSLACALVGGVAIATAIVLAGGQAPQPETSDEFGYLLAADTFAEGRVSNPTHAMWRHFETAQVFQHPTYMSKYSPGQGAILAVGQVLTGSPAAGLWLSAGLAAAAVCWMLQGWLPGRWALFGGLLVACHVWIQWRWGGSYWGGNVAMTGGALLYGALPRVTRRPTIRCSIVLGVGLILLANSRPYEGLVASVPVAVALLAWIAGRKRPPISALALRFVAPLGITLALGTAAMMSYNAALTGDPLKLPYHAWQESFRQTSPLIDEGKQAKEFDHEIFDEVKEKLGQYYGSFYTLRGWLKSSWRKVVWSWFFFSGAILLTIPACAIPRMIRARRARFLLAALVWSLAGSARIAPFHTHYLAPIAPVFFLLVVLGFRYARLWKRQGRPYGRMIFRRFVPWYAFCYFVCLTMATVDACCESQHFVGRPDSPRTKIVDQLRDQTGRHLVVVRHDPDLDWNYEWVYNRADIDAAKTVWARELSPEENRKLFEYFHDRRIWLLFADENPPRLLPHPKESTVP